MEANNSPAQLDARGFAAHLPTYPSRSPYLEQNRNCSQSIASGETFGRKLRKYIGHRGKTENLTCPTQVLTQNNSRIIVGCVWHIYIPNVGAMSIIGGNLTPSKLTMPIEKTNFIPWNLDNKGAKGT